MREHSTGCRARGRLLGIARLLVPLPERYSQPNELEFHAKRKIFDHNLLWPALAAPPRRDGGQEAVGNQLLRTYCALGWLSCEELFEVWLK